MGVATRDSVWVGSVLVVGLLGVGARYLTLRPPPSVAKAPAVARSSALLRQPVTFEPNRGQFSAGIAFVGRGTGYGLELDSTRAELRLGGGPTADGAAMSFRGANPKATPEGTGELAGVSNYLLGRDPEHWIRGVPHFGAVRFRNLYPGVDVLFHGGEGRIEYDLQVAPGADLQAIRISLDGFDQVGLDADGSLRLVLPHGQGTLSQPPPAIFTEEPDGRRRPLSGRYVLAGREISFDVAGRSPVEGLLIDPFLIYSTYLGGSGTLEFAWALAVDSSGSAVVVGTTNSTDFPIQNALQPTYSGASTGHNAFISKFAPSGSSLAFSTYLGGGQLEGPSGEQAWAVALDAAGNIWVTGWTDSADFPVTAGGVQTHFNGQATAFVVELDPTGSSILYGTLLGGSGGDYGSALALDSAGKIYVGGATYSTDFPLVGAFQSGPPGTSGSAFLAEIDPLVSGAAGLVFSTYYGGDTGVVEALAVDAQDRLYAAGSGRPVTEVLGGQDAGSVRLGGAFVARFAVNGAAIDYARVLAQYDGTAVGLGVDLAGACYVTGNTTDSLLPTTPGAFQPANPHAPGPFGTTASTFVAKVSADGTTWDYATFLGGSLDTYAKALALDPTCPSNCTATVTGNTRATDFPTVGAVPSWGDFSTGFGNYLAEVNSDGTALTLSTQLFMRPFSLANDGKGSLYMAGNSEGVGTLLMNPFQVKSAGLAVGKIGTGPAPGPTLTSISPPTGPVGGGTSVTVTGGYFESATIVTVGGRALSSPVLLSTTEISGETLAHGTGAVDVVATNPDGQQATLAGAFTYVASDGGPDSGPSGAPDAGSSLDAGAVPASACCGCAMQAAPIEIPLWGIGLIGLAVTRRKRVGRQAGTEGPSGRRS